MTTTLTRGRAFRKSDGTEIRSGDPVIDFRGTVLTFHAVTRLADGHRSAKIQLDDGFGSEVYASVIPDLAVRAPGASEYAWVIDTDHLAEEGAEAGVIATNAATVSGPSNAPADLLALLASGEGVPFRMRDDDGELYYTGRFVPASLADSEEGFGPLDDFGGPNAGAVEIEYKQGNEWVGL